MLAEVSGVIAEHAAAAAATARSVGDPISYSPNYGCNVSTLLSGEQSCDVNDAFAFRA